MKLRIIPELCWTNFARKWLMSNMAIHMPLISSGCAEYLSTYRTQEARWFLVRRPTDFIRRSHRISDAILAAVHQTNMTVKTLHTSASLAAPATTHWSHVFLVHDTVHFAHMICKTFVGIQFHFAIVAIQIVSIVPFFAIFVMDFRVLVHFQRSPEIVVAIRTFYGRILAGCFLLAIVDGFDVTGQTGAG